MKILGISGQKSDAAAALICDGEIVAAIEEEKLSRQRFVGMRYTGGLPERAIEFCLQRAGITFQEIDTVAYYLEPERVFHREIAFYSSQSLQTPAPDSPDGLPTYFVESLNDLRQHLETRRQVESRLAGRGKFLSINHHLAHGASAFFVSGFEQAAILSLGDRGDMASMAVLRGNGADLQVTAEANYPNSIGMLYNAVTAALGFNWFGDWQKTMWLSQTGEPEYAELFQDLLKLKKKGLPVLNLDYFDFAFGQPPSLARQFYERVGIKPRAKDEPLTAHHRNLAASLQNRVEEVLCELAMRVREQTQEENLCLAGGVALNTLVNSKIEKCAGFKRIFIQPAAGNAGCSLGAALYVWHQMLGNPNRARKLPHTFFGPSLDEQEVKSTLDNCKLNYEYFLTEDKLIAELVKELPQDKIVGWVRGAMEFGPRALGARSILASPMNEYMRDNLNIFIKHREDFRPFSASVPEERAAEFFEPSALTDFLQGVCQIREGKVALIPAALCGKGLARVHTVNRQTQPAFWKLLTKFGEQTGVPILLNTSFNLFGEPVVSTARETVRGFYCSGLDLLAISNFLVRK